MDVLIMALKSKIKKEERNRLVNSIIAKLILEPTTAEDMSIIFGYSRNYIGRVIKNDVMKLGFEVKQDLKYRYYITF